MDNIDDNKGKPTKTDPPLEMPDLGTQMEVGADIDGSTVLAIVIVLSLMGLV